MDFVYGVFGLMLWAIKAVDAWLNSLPLGAVLLLAGFVVFGLFRAIAVIEAHLLEARSELGAIKESLTEMKAALNGVRGEVSELKAAFGSRRDFDDDLDEIPDAE
jgi:hypothetical protein